MRAHTFVINIEFDFPAARQPIQQYGRPPLPPRTVSKHPNGTVRKTTRTNRCTTLCVPAAGRPDVHTHTCTRRRTHHERVAYVKHLWRTQIAREWFMSLAGGACVCVFTQGPARGRPAVRGFTCVCSPTHGSDTTATADRRAIRPTHCNGENVIISRGCLYYARYACASVVVSADVRKTKLFSVSYKYAVERSNGRERLDERYARTCVRNGRRFSTDADVGQTFCSRQWLNGPNHKRCT